MTEEHTDTQKPERSQASQATATEEKAPRSRLPGIMANLESPLFHEIFPAFGDPMAKLRWFWRKDLASKVFLVTITVLLVVSVFFAFSASTLLSQMFPRPVQRLNMQPNDEPKVNGTVDPHPTFPVRYGSKGTNTSSLPPKSGTVATTSGTPTGGDVQIVDIPDQVSDGDTVHVTVSGQPGTTVKLVIQYDIDPYYAESDSRTIDSDGKVTLSWDVNVSFHGKDSGTAQVTAVSDNGQSGTVSVQVSS
jgi:hypothetical protein